MTMYERLIEINRSNIITMELLAALQRDIEQLSNDNPAREPMLNETVNIYEGIKCTSDTILNTIGAWDRGFDLK